MRPMGNDGEEGDAGLFGMAQERRALAEIVQQQRRQRHEQPGILDRAAAEMAHIGIQRLAAGHRQHHRAQRYKSHPGRVQEHQQRVPGIDRRQDAGSLDQRNKPEAGQRNKPQHHHRPEQTTYFVGAVALDDKQADQDRQRQRHHQGSEAGALHFQAFHRGKHGDGRGQHAVAKEQRQADYSANADGRLGLASHAWGAVRQGRQRQSAALAVIVGAHDDQDIFDRHHQDQRPEDHGERAHHRDVIGQAAFGGQHGGAQGIERRGTDVTEHHTHGAQHQAHHVAAVVGGRFVIAIAMHIRRAGQGVAGMAFYQRFRSQSRFRQMGDHVWVRFCIKRKRCPCVLVYAAPQRPDGAGR